MTTAKQIEAALKRVRDNQDTVAIGPYTLSYEFNRGMHRCRIVKVSQETDQLFGDFVRTNERGFAFAAVSLSRIAKELAS